MRAQKEDMAYFLHTYDDSCNSQRRGLLLLLLRGLLLLLENMRSLSRACIHRDSLELHNDAKCR